jgi:hypothetical protein
MARSTLDDFLIKEKIGTGSYGAVYRATRKVDRYGGKLHTCCCPASVPVPGSCRPQQWPPASDYTLMYMSNLRRNAYALKEVDLQGMSRKVWISAAIILRFCCLPCCLTKNS